MRRADVVLNSHLQHAWRRAGVERLDPHLSIEREERIFTLICGCDPTAQGKYLSWLSAWRRRWWVDHGLRTCCDMFELDRVASGLRCFHDLRRHLPTELRDINRFETTSELLRVEAHLTETAERNLRKAERDRAYAESEILFEDGRWKLVSLLSRWAAAWWGMGTRWCTSARFNNQYDIYAAQGPLLVLITPSDRYQLAVATGEFRNSADARADTAVALGTAPQALRRILADLGGPSLARGPMSS